MRALLFLLVLTCRLHAGSVELFNEQGEPTTPLTATQGLTAGVLIDENGDFFCNAFVVRRAGKFQLTTAAHCLRDRWADQPRPSTRFVYQDERGVTRSVAVDGKASYLGQVETQDHTEGTYPLDIALVELAPNPDWKIGAGDKKTDPERAARVVYYHRAKDRAPTALYLHVVACKAASHIPAVRVTVTSVDGSSRRLDYFTAVSGKGREHHEAVDIFLDHCKIPLPAGASGAAVVDADWQPVALLHTGVTTHHFSHGWLRGGWKQKASLQAGDRVQGHFMASDAKAYGPLPEKSLFDGQGDPLFLFGAAVRLDVAARQIRD